MKSFSRKLALQGFTLFAGLAVSLGMVANAVAEFVPQKPIEFVVMAGKGGGADKIVRFFQSVVAKNKLAPVPVTPVNKPGGSGAEALVYLKSKQGDNHTIMFTLNSFYTTPLRQPGLNVDITEFTPIARMAEDTFLLWVNTDRDDIKTVDDFVKAAKAEGSDWIMAGTGRASEDNLLTDFLNTAYDLDMKYVPYRGGGRVATELAGNNADSTVNNPSEQLGFYQAGKTKPLAAFTPERLPMFKNTPTFRELGHDMVYFMQRSVVGAPGMSPEAAAYYVKLFTKVFASAEWQKYRKDKSLQGKLLTGAELMDYWKRERDVHKSMLTKMGAIKG